MHSRVIKEGSDTSDTFNTPPSQPFPHAVHTHRRSRTTADRQQEQSTPSLHPSQSGVISHYGLLACQVESGSCPVTHGMGRNRLFADGVTNISLCRTGPPRRQFTVLLQSHLSAWLVPWASVRRRRTRWAHRSDVGWPTASVAVQSTQVFGSKPTTLKTKISFSVRN